MNFDYTPKVEALREKLLAFFDEHIYPNESVCHEEVERNRANGNAWVPTEIVEQLKIRAREAGLWNLFLPASTRAAGLTNLEYAPLCEVMGRVHWAPEVFKGRLGPGRIHHCMRLVGLAERALELMAKRALARVAFGKPVAAQTVTQERVAEARCMIEQARLLTLKAAYMMDTVGNKGARGEIAMIKVVAPNMACQVLDWAMQAYGAAGVSGDFPLAYAYASARTLRFADGPDEVHRNAIAKLEYARHGDAGAAAWMELPVTRS